MRILFPLLFLPMTTCFAALEWSNTKVELKAKPTDTEISGVFQFKNAGKKDVTILQLVPSCGCTTATLEKKTYAAGEKGEITAKFEVGGRVGPQMKNITVLTDDPKDESTTLELSVDIADPLTLGPSWIDWKIGDKATVQKFPIKVQEGFKIKVTEVKTSNEFFTAELETVKEGSEYVVKVTPKKMDDRAFGLLIISTDYPEKSPRILYAQLRVQ